MVNYFHMIRKRLITIGVKPKDARTFALDFDKQIKARGAVQALEYFKSCGDTLIGYISKSKYVGPWVATTNGYPTRWLPLSKYPEEVQFRVAKMARAIVLSSPTPKMVAKLRSAATSPYSGEAYAPTELLRLVSLGLNQYKLRIPEFRFEFSSVCSAARTYTNRSVPTGTSVGLDFKSVLGVFHSWQHLIVPLPNWEQAFYPIHESWVGRNAGSFPEHPHVGELGGVMEQGGKLRIFAAPSVLLQAYLEPLQLWLDAIRDQIPTDVYRDQQAGALWAQDKMAKGHAIQSIDLSSATCRFPFDTQRILCEWLGAPRPIMRLYEEVARATWKVQPHLVSAFGESIKWTVGQPLGVNPSMSSFALCHNLLLAGLCVDMGLDTLDSFRVLGDDVVTSDRALAIRYREVITRSGIAISEHKCYDSNTYAEFAGYSITPSILVRPGRWRAASVLNVQGLVKDLGASVIDELSTDHHFLERLIAFHDGLFDPPEREWNDWLRLNTLVFTSNLTDITLRHHEMSWFDGCTAFLQRQFPGIYFGCENSKEFLDTFKGNPEPVQRTRELLFPLLDLGWAKLGQVCLTLESFSKDLLTYSELIVFIDEIQRRYEEYLWSLPKTAGRLLRERRDLVRVSYLNLTVQ